MNATELRIGNYVYCDLKDIYWRISIVKEDFVNVYLKKETPEYKHSPSISEKRLNPIPLTKEWLLKFGFELENENFFYIKFDNKAKNNGSERNFFIDKILIDMEIDQGDYVVWFCNSVSDEMLCNRIKYLHQLQNLYYSLTGTELLLAKNKTETDNSIETES